MQFVADKKKLSTYKSVKVISLLGKEVADKELASHVAIDKLWT